MDAPILSDGQDPDPIVLRLHTTADVEALVQMCRDPQMQLWTTVPTPYEREHAEQFVASRAGEWERRGDCTLAIDAVDDDGRARLAGGVALRLNSTGAAGLGYALAPWARGRGVMSRAVRLMLGWGFEQARLQVVHWQAHVGNWPSRRVAWACGFTVEGTVRGLCEQRGQQHDAWIGSLVPGEPMAPRTPWLAAETIVGEQVVLRAWREDDAPQVAEACADPVSQHWLAQLPSPYTVADAQAFIRTREEGHASGSGVFWCIASPDDDRCLGSISLMRLGGSAPEPEVGYWLHPAARGRGVMTEATRLAVRHAMVPFEDGGLGCVRVVLRAAAGNAASRAVAERVGMGEFGVAHDGERLRDGTMDLVLYEALARHVTADA